MEGGTDERTDRSQLKDGWSVNNGWILEQTDRNTVHDGMDNRTDGQVIMEWTDRQVRMGRTIGK